jgi:hypothetical protein
VAYIDNPEFGVDAPELGVLAADGDVVEEDIASRVTSGRRDGLVEQEPRPGVGAQCAVVSTTRKRAWLVTIR